MKYLLFVLLLLGMVPAVNATFEFQPGIEFNLTDLYIDFDNNISVGGWEPSTNKFNVTTGINNFSIGNHILSLNTNGQVNVTYNNIDIDDFPNHIVNFSLINNSAGITGTFILGGYFEPVLLNEYVNGVLNRTVSTNDTGDALINYDFGRDLTVLRYERVQNLTMEPTTPPSGTGGGYEVDLNFTANVSAAATVGGYEPFVVRATLFVSDSSIAFGSPVLVFEESGVEVGTYGMNYVRGSGNNVTYERTVKLPPGVYTYFLRVETSNNINLFSGVRNINVRVPADENVTGVTQPSKAFFGLLVTFTDETTPKSHSRVSQSDGIYISGLAVNVGGTVSNVSLFILNEPGTTILNTIELSAADNGDNTSSLFGFAPLPENVTRIAIQLGVIDTDGRAAYSVSRKLIVLSENPEGVIRSAMIPFLNPFGDDNSDDSGTLSPGRIFAATIIMVVLIGGLYASGAGTLPAVGFGVMVSMEFASFGIIPTWVSILGAVLIGYIAMRDVFNMWLRR